ncbi:MAG TPA: hypothetical protein VES67_15985 [Vicinamibacterales bacterium]|nr:hypothetical protein [Vicinamibacterales bacterium]
MRVHLVNPSDLSFGTAVITPRWLYVLAAATPGRFETSRVVDETLEPFNGVPLTRYWLIPSAQRPKVYSPHPLMSPDEIRRRTQAVWDRFYRLAAIWQRSACVRSIRSRVAFVLLSKLYRQMYANTGIATDSARVAP